MAIDTKTIRNIARVYDDLIEAATFRVVFEGDKKDKESAKYRVYAGSPLGFPISENLDKTEADSMCESLNGAYANIRNEAERLARLSLEDILEG